MTPLVIAHRGGADLWPENTLAAFKRAISVGADGAELDVHLSQDGVPVVFHDEMLKPEIVRGPDGQWLTRPTKRLKDLSLAELKLYDVGRLKPGSGYGARHPMQTPIDGDRIPTLAEVIALAKTESDSFQLWIELKTDIEHVERGADPVALAEAVVGLVREMAFATRTVFVSFDWRALARAIALAPEIPAYATTLPESYFRPGDPPAAHGPPPAKALAALREAMANGAPWEGPAPRKDFPSLQHAVKSLGAAGWFPFFPDADGHTVKQTRDLGLKLAVWTPPASETARLVALRVDAICTDDPVAVRNIIATNESNIAPHG